MTKKGSPIKSKRFGQETIMTLANHLKENFHELPALAHIVICQFAN